MAEEALVPAPSRDSTRPAPNGWIWFWTDAAGRSGLPPALLSLGLLGLLYLSATIIALFGEWDVFVRDFRWLVSFAGVALCSFYVVYLLREIDQLWTALRPWVVDVEQLESLKARTREILGRRVAVCLPIWIAFTGLWAATNSWGVPYREEWLPQALNAMFAPFLWYFGSVAMGIATMGVWALIRANASELELKPAIVFPQGRSALQPFHRLLLENWLFFVLITLCATIATTPWTGQAANLADDGYSLPDFLLWALLGGIALVLISCQRSLDYLLGRVKSRTLADLHHQFDETAALPADASATDVLRRMHEMNVILHQTHQVEAFTPTLVDGRFVLQVCLSVSAIIIANVLLRLAIDGL
jgi:hypothetical protein